jgi:hypothetical protein
MKYNAKEGENIFMIHCKRLFEFVKNRANALNWDRLIESNPDTRLFLCNLERDYIHNNLSGDFIDGFFEYINNNYSIGITTGSTSSV